MSEVILIVEDHPAVRLSLRDWLASAFPLCRLVEATTGEEALELAQQYAPSIILMDIGLPVMNGLEATRAILTDLPAARVVILTIHEATDYRIGSGAAGAVAFIPKRRMYLDLLPLLSQLLATPVAINSG